LLFGLQFMSIIMPTHSVMHRINDVLITLMHVHGTLIHVHGTLIHVHGLVKEEVHVDDTMSHRIGDTNLSDTTDF